jgi:hypothetical protein
MNFHTPRIPNAEQEAIKIVAWVLEHPDSEITCSGASDAYANAVLNRVQAIMLGSPFRVVFDASKWHGIWGTNG